MLPLFRAIEMKVVENRHQGYNGLLKTSLEYQTYFESIAKDLMVHLL